MVEIRRFVSIAVASMFCCAVHADNGADMLRRADMLRLREDSLARVVTSMRSSAAGDNRASADEIAETERMLFALRAERMNLAREINVWECEHGAIRPSDDEAPDGLHGIRRANLVMNDHFSVYLPDEERSLLLAAQERETAASGLARRYAAQYERMAEIKRAYDACKDEATAEGLYAEYIDRRDGSAMTADSLAAVWSSIFDDKTYSYDYMLDAADAAEAISRAETIFADMRSRTAAAEGRYASDAFSEYVVQKLALLDYEIDIARTLELPEAADSLAAARQIVAKMDFRRPTIVVVERHFLDYDEVTFNGHGRKTIEECPVYEHGTIYRLLLGTFNARQIASRFRDVDPLWYWRNAEGRYCYLTGGYETRDEALVAQRILKERGFLRPEVVAWRDGRFVAPEELAAERSSYSVVLSGAGSLDEAVRAGIAAAAPECVISRIGESTFVAGTFHDRETAEAVAAAVRAADSSVEVKITER